MARSRVGRGLRQTFVNKNNKSETIIQNEARYEQDYRDDHVGHTDDSAFACGSAGAAAPAAQDQNGQPSAAAAEASPEEQPAAEGENAEEGGKAVEAAPDTSASDGKTLVVVFSATGTTKGVADKIAAI